MNSRQRTEKQTALLPRALFARGKEAAAVLACDIARLGGEVEMSNGIETWKAPADAHEIIAAKLQEFCACGSPAEVLVPAGDEFEGVEGDCWDCAEKTVVIG